MKRALLNTVVIMTAAVAIESHYLIIGGCVALFLLAAVAGLKTGERP